VQPVTPSSGLIDSPSAAGHNRPRVPGCERFMETKTMMPSFLRGIAGWSRVVCLAVTAGMLPAIAVSVLAEPADNRWEPAIRAFERDDRETAYPDNAILFVGSSSIRLWDTLAADMAPHAVIQRGFGGARTADVVRYAERILAGRRPPALVLFVANDIRGDAATDLEPAEAAAQFKAFLDHVRRESPETVMLVVAVTPTESRWAVWPQIRRLNQRLAGLCDETAHTIFIPTEDLYLGPTGRPQPELFRTDRLHLSPAGYARWTKRIRSYLDPLVAGPGGTEPADQP
jgi:lysophospholipase L1-like esterase